MAVDRWLTLRVHRPGREADLGHRRRPRAYAKGIQPASNIPYGSSSSRKASARGRSRKHGMPRSPTSSCSIGVSAGASTSVPWKGTASGARTCREQRRERAAPGDCVLPCLKLQLDEVWSFVAAKERNVPTMKKSTQGAGSVWTWVAIDAQTKLLPCWLVGLRDGEYAKTFVCDLASRLANRVQITMDGLRAYVEAMEAGFAGEVDDAPLHKKSTGPRRRTKAVTLPLRASAARSGASVGIRTRRT